MMHANWRARFYGIKAGIYADRMGYKNPRSVMQALAPHGSREELYKRLNEEVTDEQAKRCDSRCKGR